MRIVHVSDCYLPRLGGIEIQVHDLAAHQIAVGHDVRVLTSTHHPASSAEAGGTAADPVPVTRINSGPLNLPSAAEREQLRRLLGGAEIDAVHLHSSVVSPLAWTVARMATDQLIPTVLTMHSVLAHPQALLRLFGSLAGWDRRPMLWTAVSEVAASPLRQVLGTSAVGVLPNGIDPQAWHPARARSSGDPLTIVSVMRLAQRKRPLALLRTLADIRELIPESVPLRAVLIGDGPQQARMERYLHSTGLQSWVTLTGRLSRAQIRPLLCDADVYLAPATLESFGIAALEARCAGLPVIAMAGGGVGEFIRDGHEGFLVGSDQEMAEATAELLMSSRLQTMQAHNRRTVPQMTWPWVVGLSLELYRLAGAAVMHSERPAHPLHV